MRQDVFASENGTCSNEPPLDPPLEPPLDSFSDPAFHSLARPDASLPGLALHAAKATARPAAKATERRGPLLPFPLSRSADAWRKTHFPHASRENWGDWRWQLAQRVTSGLDLQRFLSLSAEELQACGQGAAGLPLAVTPHYLALMHPQQAAHPLRRCMTPSVQEHVRTPGERVDPLAEERHTLTPGLVHRYPDRALFLATDYCAAYCRYCTRSRLVGRRKGAVRKQWQAALDRIAATPSIRDVIISGGDPLTLSDDALDWLLSCLRRIRHVEVLRIGTKTPAVLPQRITRKLVRMLKKHHPIWMSLHCTHPLELTPEMETACSRLADVGIPLGSQTVLLKDVNDSLETLRGLFLGLMRLRVRPYYLYQCDPVPGSSHFRTPVSRGLQMLQGLRGHISGYAVPQFVVDAPGGGGKIPLMPDAFRGHDAEGNLLLRNYEGKVHAYPDGDSQ